MKVHAYWENLGEEQLIQEVKATLQGHKTSAFDFHNHRFTPRVTRFERLSDASSTAILQLVADTGSYYHRLNYTINRLQDLTKSPIHSALLASIDTKLSALSTPDPQSILQYATGIQPYARQLYELCKVIGCDNLDVDISLDNLPPAKLLLDRCFDMSWPLFIDCIEPWLQQLHRMIDPNNSTSTRLIWEYPQVYIPEMFSTKQNARFVLVEENVPNFVPHKFAQMAVECLNYRLIIFALNASSNATLTGKRRRECQESVIDPFADTSQRQYPVGAIDATISSTTSAKLAAPTAHITDKVFAVHEMLSPILAQHQILASECNEHLQPLLRTHFKLISDIFFLMNGQFWMACREEIAQFTHRPSRAQLEPMNKLIRNIAPPCVFLDLQMNERLVKCVSDNIIVEYTPPKELEMIITEPLIQACSFAFSILLNLQQENRKSPMDIIELQLYSTMLRHHCMKLEAIIETDFNLEEIVQTFDKFKDTLLDFK